MQPFAFFDDGSSLTLIEERLVEQLGIDGITVPLCLLWTANVSRIEKESKQVSLIISAAGGRCPHSEESIAADIKAMFHKILIRQEDRHSQRFLWRHDPSITPDILFPSISIYQYIKNKNVKEFKDIHSRAVEENIQNHYVDDSLESYESI